MLSYMLIEERITASRPLWRIRKLADQVLDRVDSTFCELGRRRPAIGAAEHLLLGGCCA